MAALGGGGLYFPGPSLINRLSRFAVGGAGGAVIQDPSTSTARPSAASAALRRPPASVYFSCTTSTSSSASTISSSALSAFPSSYPTLPMASDAISADSSNIATPRSSSPSSSTTSRTSVSNKRMSISGRRLTDFNPLSSVDFSAIEEAMRMAALDQHRGYAKDSFGEVKQEGTTEYLHKNHAAGYQIIREPLWNRGMPFLLSRRCRWLRHRRGVLVVARIPVTDRYFSTSPAASPSSDLSWMSEYSPRQFAAPLLLPNSPLLHADLSPLPS